MKRTIIILLAAALVLAGFTSLHREPYNGARYSEPVEAIPAMEYQKMLGVGINVDWMKYPWVNCYYFHWRSLGIRVPRYFREAGFTNVRIRVGIDVTTNHTALIQLGMIVNDTLETGLIPVIAYTARDLRVNPESIQAQEHFLNWWLTIAEYFKHYPYTLSYDLLIESSGKVKDHPEILNKLYQELIKEIRSMDPHRIIIVTPPGRSSPLLLDELNITNDGYIMAEWHIYAGGPRGCSYNMTYIEESIQAALTWSRRTGIPTWMGAWRPNDYPKPSGKNPRPLCPISLEENFTATMVAQLTRANIPYDVNSDTRFFNIANLTRYSSQERILEIIVNHKG